MCALTICLLGHGLVCQRLVKLGHVGGANQSFVVRVQRSDEVSLLQGEIEQHQQDADHYHTPIVHPAYRLSYDHVAAADWTDETSESQAEDISTQFATTLMSKIDV